MTKFSITIAFIVCSFLSVNAQYEQGMGKAMQLWGEGKPEEAISLFERIASAEKNNWLPNYYVAFINTIGAFNPANKEKAAGIITKAQSALDAATVISPNNDELLVVQAMLYTAILTQDPMNNGMKYSKLAMEEYGKALAINPN